MSIFSTDELIIIFDVFKSAIRDGLDVKFIFEELRDSFSQSPKKAAAINEVAQRVFTSGTVSEGFRGLISDNEVEAISFAYEKGQVDTVLEELQKTYENKQKIARQLRKAISYPIVVLFMFFILAVLALAFIIPVIEKSTKDIDPKKIPEFNKKLYFVSHLIRDHYILFIAILGIIAFIVFLVFKKYKTKILFNIPVIKNIVQTQENIVSFKMLAIFHNAGVNIQKAFFSIAETLTGKFRDVFMETSKMLSNGKTITDAFVKMNVEKKYIVRIKTGELTGKIDEAFEKISILEQQKIETHMSVLTKTVNIVLLILAGLSAIGFYAITVLPTFKIAGL